MCESYDNVLMFVAVSTFLISELLPFLGVKGNGIAHFLHQAYKSKCCEDKDGHIENEEEAV